MITGDPRERLLEIAYGPCEGACSSRLALDCDCRVQRAWDELGRLARANMRRLEREHGIE